MKKIFFIALIPLVIAVVIYIVNLTQSLISAPSDMAVFAGLVILCFSIFVALLAIKYSLNKLKNK